MVTTLRNKRGFNSVDTAVTIGLVGLMAVAMAPLVKRGAQAKVKSGVEALGKVQGTGDLSNFKALEQYEPYYAESDQTTERTDSYTESYAKGKYSKTGVVSGAIRAVGGKQIEHGADKLGDDNTWQ